MSDLLKQAKYLLTEVDPNRIEPSRAEVAFIGRSNVGKSSFLNVPAWRKQFAGKTLAQPIKVGDDIALISG